MSECFITLFYYCLTPFIQMACDSYYGSISFYRKEDNPWKKSSHEPPEMSVLRGLANLAKKLCLKQTVSN